MSPSSRELRPGFAVRGTAFPGPAGRPPAHTVGADAGLTGAGESAGRVHGSVLTSPQHALVEATPENEPLDSEAPRRQPGAARVRPKTQAR